jgi:hypothetical protein
MFSVRRFLGIPVTGKILAADNCYRLQEMFRVYSIQVKEDRDSIVLLNVFHQPYNAVYHLPGGRRLPANLLRPA